MADLWRPTQRPLHPPIHPAPTPPRQDVNMADPERRTPLHWAAGMDHADVAALLLREGASLEAADSKGNTPLMYAGAGYMYAGAFVEHVRRCGAVCEGSGQQGQHAADVRDAGARRRCACTAGRVTAWARDRLGRWAD